MKTYDFQKIEQYWQNTWEKEQTYRAPNPGDADFEAHKPKFYVLDMFPYPSGVGLHVGHPLGYIATDVYSRYKRMAGFNVLHPMGFDAFGLPAEQFAIETGTHPEITTQKNIENMRRQLRMCALSYDWGREFATTDPDYYRWTQWIFLKLFHSYFDPHAKKAKPIAEIITRAENGEFDGDLGKPWKNLNAGDREKFLSQYRLAYIAEVPVNWCPGLGTVLANEEVTADGRSERGNFPVYKRPLKQWMLRITAYADLLVDELNLVNWPEAVKLMQRNWVGRSTGAEITFDLDGFDEKLTIFTTRPDTLFGCTFMVIAPEHPLVNMLTTELQKPLVEAFMQRLRAKSPEERQNAESKDGVFIGAYALHPITQQKVPVWIADYVLMGYGTGAIMAVPAHDERDHAFATKYQIPMLQVLQAPKEVTLAKDTIFTGEGTAINSAHGSFSLNGLTTAQAKEKMITHLISLKKGQSRVQYKLRDWLFSRQRYWGEPFPILHGTDGELVAVNENELPVKLPPLSDFKPRSLSEDAAEPEPSLGRAEASWKEVRLGNKTYKRELNTMPNWAGSCWYYLRFATPKSTEAFVTSEAEKYWMGENGVDLYVGGVEHAVLHLLYARFWHKVLHDLGFVSTREPFGRLFNQGYIQAYSYQDERGMYVDATQVQETSPGVFMYEGKAVTRHLGKMGKSLKNAISPDEVIAKYGCDTFRLYEMYLGPVEQSKVWDTDAIIGVHRFLQKVWRNYVNEETGDLKISTTPAKTELLQKLHETIHIVSSYMEELRFNAAIAQLMIFNNYVSDVKEAPVEVIATFSVLLAPFAPHIGEELWKKLGMGGSLTKAPWPKADPKLMQKNEIEIVVQINGKRRASVFVAPQTGQEQVVAAAHADEGVIRHLEGKKVVKTIFVPNRLLNLVVN